MFPHQEQLDWSRKRADLFFQKTTRYGEEWARQRLLDQSRRTWMDMNTRYPSTTESEREAAVQVVYTFLFKKDSREPYGFAEFSRWIKSHEPLPATEEGVKMVPDLWEIASNWPTMEDFFATHLPYAEFKDTVRESRRRVFTSIVTFLLVDILKGEMWALPPPGV